MWWRRGGIAALALALALGPLPVASQSLMPLVVGWEQTFAIDWSLGEDRGQRVVQGYVVNRSGEPTKRIRLLVETVEGGRVVGQRLGWLGTDLTPGTRTYFKVAVPAPASTYRVSVFDFEFRKFGAEDLTRAVALEVQGRGD
jgi:hypothetical protein